MFKWEYLKKTFYVEIDKNGKPQIGHWLGADNHPDFKNFEIEYLNYLGKTGWELVGFQFQVEDNFHANHYIFKRPIE